MSDLKVGTFYFFAIPCIFRDNIHLLVILTVISGLRQNSGHCLKQGITSKTHLASVPLYEPVAQEPLDARASGCKYPCFEGTVELQ